MWRRASCQKRWGSGLSSSKRRIAQETKRISEVNPVGIQYLPREMMDKVLGPGVEAIKPRPELVSCAKKHLDHHQLLGKKTSREAPINFPLPKLAGKSLDEHFYRIGREMSEPYLQNSLRFIRNGIPKQPSPDEWIKKSGWMRYEPGKEPQYVEYPDNEEVYVFDTEVLYKESPFAVMCTAVSEKAWYCWLSPWLLGETENPRQLIPVGRTEKKVIIGHNVSYDRKRLRDEYHIKKSNTFFLDTMSLHVATNGMCSQQRPTWIKMNKASERIQTEDNTSTNFNDEEQMLDIKNNPWFHRSALNNLHDVAYLHCDIKIDKSRRNYFAELDREGILNRLNELIDYCASDVDVTFKVFCKVMPHFLEVCPHPVSFAALGQLSSVFLPISSDWEKYVSQAEETYQNNSREVYEELKSLAEYYCSFKDDPEKFINDPWLSQLDWTITPIKMVKGKKKGEPDRPAARQKLPGRPQWYRDLFPTAQSPMHVTVRSRITARLLRLQWEGKPLIWSDLHGYIFRVDKTDTEQILNYTQRNYVKCDFNEEPNIKFRDDVDGIYFRIPHKDGASGRCTNPMAKGYLNYFDKDILTSEYESAKKAIKLNCESSYWISVRDRITHQMPIYSHDTDMGAKSAGKNSFGMILPKITPMGTITRRAVEDSWLTASNAKKNRIGSELKAMVQAPKDYKFIGADVDSEELWIASLIGDSLFGVHGGSALGWMTLEGSKAEGTDLHSRTAQILGISRNDAKVFNYGRIYGAGQKFAMQLLKQFNPSLSDKDIKTTVEKLYESTKGAKFKSTLFEKNLWRGGTESVVFNQLEELSGMEQPRTPVLGAAITEALMKKNLGAQSYLTSRINWSIQSSGVDYLHLLVCSMDYLVKQFGIRARLSITVHDEVRFIVHEKDQYRAALALQISNLWTRALFCQQLGLTDLPQSVAFFSLVDIDHVMRKEVDLDCVTPSHPTPIEPGIALNIHEILEKCPKLQKSSLAISPDYQVFEYKPRVPVLQSINDQPDRLDYLKIQTSPTSSMARKQERRVMNYNQQDLEMLNQQELEPLSQQDLELLNQNLQIPTKRRTNKKKKKVDPNTSQGIDDSNLYKKQYDEFFNQDDYPSFVRASKSSQYPSTGDIQVV